MWHTVLVLSIALSLTVSVQAETAFFNINTSQAKVNQGFERLLKQGKTRNIGKSRSISTGKTRSIHYDEPTILPPDNFAIAIQIQFAYDSAELDADSKATLGKIANALVKPDLSDKSLVIAGHTDSRGTESYNENLGYQRAMAVRDYLARPDSGTGVAQHRMQITSYGETDPIDTSNTEAAINRRVEFLSQIR